MSFQATEWARSLPLHSLSAKFTLMMIGSYAGTDGTCFPSLTTLAEDTMQSVDTVRRRIRELEQLELLVRLARWTSPDGKVVVTEIGDGTKPSGCRQSSDELRLLLKTTGDDVEARIAALGWDKKKSHDQDDNPPEGVANCQGGEDSTAVPPAPSHSSATPPVAQLCNPLNRLSNSSEETAPLNPPASGGTIEADSDLKKIGRQRIATVEPLWPEPITNAERAVVILGSLTEQEWADCQIGVKGYAAFIRSRHDVGKDRTVKDFHNWARNRQWAGYLTKGAEVEQAGKRVHAKIDGDAGRAWRNLHTVGRVTPTEFDGQYLLPGMLSPQVMALANAPPPSDWVFIPESNKQQAGAWSSFLRSALEGKARPSLIDDRNWRGSERIAERGFVAPWPWPPRKDGTLSTTGSPPDTYMTEADVRDLDKLKAG
jgi:hypothetical protein